MGVVRPSFAAMAAFLSLSAFADVPVAPFRPLTTEIPRTAVPRPGSLRPQSLPNETVRISKDPEAFRQEQAAKLREMSKLLGKWRKGDPNRTPEDFLKASGLEKQLQQNQVPQEQIELIKRQLIDAIKLSDRLQQQSGAAEGGDR